jgi:antitoxin Phd
MDRWQLQEAKNRLSELVRKAADEGPQMITLRGADAAVVVSAKEFAQMSRRKSRKSLVQVLRGCPVKGISLDIERSRDTGREIDL